MPADTVEKILSIEWEMFQAVNEGGPRAACQDDGATFYAMRRAQFDAWSEEAQYAYLMDLTLASLGGRNPVMEKYIHMMRDADPEAYAELIKRAETPASRARSLAGELNRKLMAQAAELFARYPCVAGRGRPLYAERDPSGVISVETYQLGELLTYSEATLAALGRHVAELEREGRSLAELILLNEVKYYGYADLEHAEAAAEGEARDA